MAYQPKKYRAKRSPSGTVLLILVLLAAGWWLWRGLFPAEPRFVSLEISVNNEPRNILPGETLSLHTGDKVRITRLYTNVLFNAGVDLVSENFDVNALYRDGVSLASLLPQQEIFDHYTFRVMTRYGDQDLGYTDWDIQPFAEDWLERANKTINEDERIAVLKRAGELLPQDSRIWRRLLDEYKARKKWKQAVEMLEKAAETDPNKEILSELLEVYTSMSSKTQVLSVLNRLVALDPGNTNLRLQLAELLEQNKRYNDAITQYERVKRDVGGKTQLYVYERLGYLYTITEDYNTAISGYLKAVTLNPKDANLYYNLSYLYDKTKQPQKSSEYLEKAVSLNPTDMDSRLALAQRFVDKGEFGKADKLLAEILAKNPSSLKALLLKAKTAEKRGDKKELRAIYQKVYAVDPKNDTVLYNLGALSYEAGDLASGLNFLTRYVKNNPKDAAAQEIIFDIYRKQKNDAKAFETAQSLVRLKSDKTALYHFMFDYLNRKQEYARMIPILEQGIRDNPKDMNLREQVLYAYLKTGKEDKAVEQMNAILAARPKDLAMWLQLARLYEKQNKDARAMEAYKKVLALAPDNEEAGEAYLRLRMKTVGGQ